MLFKRSENKLKILLDASLLGQSYKSNMGKTGIFRVAVALAHEFAKKKDIDLLFTCPSHTKEDIDFCSNFIANDSFLSNHHFVPLPQWNKLGFKRDKFIYISLISDFGNDILNMRNAVKTIFVHDLIPILFNYHTEGMRNYFDDVIFAQFNQKTHIWADSENTKNDVLAYLPKIKKEQITKIVLAAEDFFKPAPADKVETIRRKYGLKKNDKYILSVCTLEPRKNLTRTIQCFIEFLKKYAINDLYLILTGTKGWSFESIFAEIAQMEYKDKIIFTDFIHDEDLPAIYSGALFFTYLSLYEGFGLPPLEAMNCGTPVITSNTSSLPEVIGEAGMMVDPRNNEEIIQAFYDLYKNDQKRGQLSQQGLERAKLFTWDTCVNIMLEKMNSF